MDTREQKIDHAYKAFAGHIAELGDFKCMEILDWQKPGDCWYRVRYVFDREGRRIYISGDLGAAVVCPTWSATLDNTYRNVCRDARYAVNEGYFLEKVETTTDRYVYDRAAAEAEVKARCPDIDEWDLETVMSDFDDQWGLRHIGDKARKILNAVDEDCWEWFPTAGQSISPRVYLWLVGMKMAWHRIDGIREVAANTQGV